MKMSFIVYISKYMKTIEINTSFNVNITFNQASVFQRGMAYFVDMLIVWLTIGLIWLISMIFVSEPTPLQFFLIAGPIFGFYTLVFEIVRNGQTIGKRAMRIQVIRIDGKRSRISDSFMRWIFRLVDIYFSASLLAILTITASKKGQRLGDMLADTCVIRIRERPEISLPAILKLNELQNHTPEYPEVTRLTESDMMTIKEAVDRFRKHPNEGHQRAIDVLTANLEELLQIKCGNNKVRFLNDLIRDYVILTR